MADVPKIEWRDDPDAATEREIADIGAARLFVQFCNANNTKNGVEFWRWDVLTDDRYCWGGNVGKKSTAIARCEALGTLLWKADQYDQMTKRSV